MTTTIVFSLTIDGQRMHVRYTPNWITLLICRHGRLDFVSPHEPAMMTSSSRCSS